ncbi:hypothetical protein L596_001079 [Steinernema carpocapsae]|uniref:Uncharacterized protein n=1 Tax=Steinernema carpocapsae TaxID=34508 RepID=A0A4U8UJX5_STECR|nr:hypothetical protein L596_001079 [Steinernema carpocapsae]
MSALRALYFTLVGNNCLFLSALFLFLSCSVLAQVQKEGNAAFIRIGANLCLSGIYPSHHSSPELNTCTHNVQSTLLVADAHSN